jgi:hypothetical protein
VLKDEADELGILDAEMNEKKPIINGRGDRT